MRTSISRVRIRYDLFQNYDKADTDALAVAINKTGAAVFAYECVGHRRLAGVGGYPQFTVEVDFSDMREAIKLSPLVLEAIRGVK